MPIQYFQFLLFNRKCFLLQQLEHALALKDVALADQLRRLEMMELTSYSGVLVWKIHNFAKKKQDAMNGTQTSIYSPCFYTSRFGYKMCARFVFLLFYDKRLDN